MRFTYSTRANELTRDMTLKDIRRECNLEVVPWEDLDKKDKRHQKPAWFVHFLPSDYIPDETLVWPLGRLLDEAVSDLLHSVEAGAIGGGYAGQSLVALRRLLEVVVKRLDKEGVPK